MCFKVIFGQCLGLSWVHLDDFPLGTIPCINEDVVLIARGPDWALSMADGPPRGDFHDGRLWIHHLRRPRSTWIVRTYRVAWERSRVRLRMEVFRGSYLQNGVDEWKACNIEVSDFLVRVDYHHDHRRESVVLVRIQGVSCCKYTQVGADTGGRWGPSEIFTCKRGDKGEHSVPFVHCLVS